LIAHRGVNRILEYLVTAFADLIHAAADFDQQVAVLRLAGSQHFQIRTVDVLDVIAKRRNRLVLNPGFTIQSYKRVTRTPRTPSIVLTGYARRDCHRKITCERKCPARPT